MKIVKVLIALGALAVLAVLAYTAFSQIPNKAKASVITGAIKSATEAKNIAKNTIQKDVWIDGLKTPWSLVFLNETNALVTEIQGRLRIIENGKLTEQAVSGTPKVWHNRQGGLLEVAIDPNYKINKWVYISFAHPLETNSKIAMTKLVRGRIKDNAWADEQVLFAAKPEHYTKVNRHFGGRITFDDTGHIYFSIGDRGNKDLAQDLTTPNGKIYRLMHDGSIPQDNPFVGIENAYKAIYAYGSRNAQGLLFTGGKLWSTEHGPKGGDELNLIKAGGNYGWPKISYGTKYSGEVLTPYTHIDGMEQPVSQWTPSIAASGLGVYQGSLFPDWNGYLLAGSLKYQELRLIKLKDGQYVSEQILLQKQGRIRDIKTGSDGALYVVMNSPDQIVKITPK